MENNGYVNGSGAGVSAPAPDAVVVATPQLIASDTANRNTSLTVVAGREIDRFMPVMDIDQAVTRRQAIVDATAKLMREGVDFGKIPGTERPTLLQPGADKLCNLFGLVIQYETVKSVEDWTGEEHGGIPFFFYEIKGRAYRGEFLMGEGTGSCNSWESKYRYRKAERLCPNCGKANIRKSKDGGGWYCWAKTDGCGTNFAAGDPRIETQETGRKLNPDMYDGVNTIFKMGAKRAKIAATINATSASEFFTQDVEDRQRQEDPDPHGYTIDTGGQPFETRPAQQYVAAQKLARAMTPPAELSSTKSGEIRVAFAELRERLGESRYLEEMQLSGISDPLQLRDLRAVKDLYRRLSRIAELAQQQERGAA